MRNLIRNQRTLWYCPFRGKERIRDERGHDTGEKAVTYGDPVGIRGSVSAATGDATQEAFGIGVSYDRVVQLPGTGWPIDEHAVLYVDRRPPDEPDPLCSGADYAVVRVSESLNQTSIAISRIGGR